MLEAIKETVSFIKERTKKTPELAIILGTGLGQIGEDIEISESIDYHDIPNFPVSTVEGHKGQLIFGELGGKQVVALQGRFHYYEGYTMQELTFPIRVLKYLGIKTLIVSNAAGGMNPGFEVGDIMIINDHINLMPNPLIGKHHPEFGERFPDMSETYSKELQTRAQEIASSEGITVRTGCYVGVTGPTLETPKEYQYFRIIGGDAVGMSTVPEAIVAHQMGITIFAVSVITDLGVPGKIIEITHKAVQDIASGVAPTLTKLIEKLIATI